jgi:hypothetical protein
MLDAALELAALPVHMVAGLADPELGGTMVYMVASSHLRCSLRWEVCEFEGPAARNNNSWHMLIIGQPIGVTKTNHERHAWESSGCCQINSLHSHLVGVSP